MEENVRTHREEIRRLVFRYRKDIVYLEEKEEDLVRRIQILENLIPTVLIWYMWKAKNDGKRSQFTEEEATNKLNHLETILKELQNADQIMKKEEAVLRKRIEELEESLDKDLFSNIYIKQSSPSVSLPHDQVKAELATLNRKINKVNEKRLNFVDFLQDSDRDWQKTCEELVNEVNNLKDILEQSNNVKSKYDPMHKKVESSIEKDDVIKGKIDDLENKTKLLYEEVIDQEQKSIAREESQDEKVFSMVQDAMDEIDSLKKVMRDSNKEKVVEGRSPKDVSFKKPVMHKIVEEEKEEAEIDLGESNSPVIYPISSTENKPSPLVLNFQDKAFSGESSQQKSNAGLTSPEEAKEKFINGQPASDYKYVEKRSTVEAVTTTDIQLPPSAEVDQLLQIGKLNNLSHPSTTEGASGSSVDKTFPDQKLPSKSDLPLTISQTLEDKHEYPTESHPFTGELPIAEALESHEQMPLSPASQKQGLDSPQSQMATISSLEEFSEKSPSVTVSPKPIVSKTSHQMPLPITATFQVPSPEQTEARALTSPDSTFTKIISPRTETDVSKEPQTLTSKSVLPTVTAELIHTPLTIVSEYPLPDTEYSGTEIAVTYVPQEQKDFHKSVPSQSALSTVTPQFIHPPDYPLLDTAPSTPTTTVTKSPQEQTGLVGTVTPQSTLSTPSPEFVHPYPKVLPKSPLQDTASPVAITAASKAPQEKADLYKTISQSASTTSEFVCTLLPDTESPTTSTAISKAPADQISGPQKAATHSQLPEVTSDKISPLTSSQRASSLRIEKADLPYDQAGPSKAIPTKSLLAPKTVSQSVFLETSLGTKTDVSKAPSNQTGNKSYPTDIKSETVFPTSLLPRTTSNIADRYDPVMSSEPKERSDIAGVPGNQPQSQAVPASERLNLGKTGDNTVALESYEVPNTDGDFPTSSGAQGQDNSSPPDRENLADNTLQSKCRVKDHLIKTLADQVRAQARGNVGSGDKLLSEISRDPVKNYDFDRHTLAKYLKGEGPKDIDATLRSNPTYSNTNQLKVEVLQKLDKNSLIIKWGPAPPQEVVGFQIFVDGEFMYWVHSATRNIALLQPLDLSEKHEIAVSPVDSKGTIILRSSVTYTPK